MNMDFSTCFYLTKLAIVFLSTLQFIEYFLLKSTYKEDGIWNWVGISTNSDKSISFLHRLKKWFLVYPNALALLSFRQTLLFLYLAFPSGFLILLVILSHLLFLSRWQGTFNGGSDYMTNILLVGLLISQVSLKGPWHEAGLIYIAIHSSYSYFKAGVVKLVSLQWRKGIVLEQLLQTSAYNTLPVQNRLKNHSKLALSTCWLIILFEILFPFSILHTPVLYVFLVCGVLFHLANIYLLGLNRFFWAWVATYPSLIYLSQKLSKIII